MTKSVRFLRDLAITAGILAGSFFISQLLQDVFQVPEHITTAFVFGVFLVSLLTDGYLWGLLAALSSVLLVNFAFTFPYFALDFMIPANFFSALVMSFIALMTSALTTKVKHQRAVQAEMERERMRGNLLRAVSHDLRTPLTTIYGSATALLESPDSLTPDQKTRILQGIREDSQWLVRMVENLLSITRIGGAGVKLAMTATALDELVDAVMVQFQKRYPDQNVELELPEDLVMIPMDPMLMEQVLLNILENAVQHARGMTRLGLQVTQRNGQAVFEVRDNGCGIPPERLEHLFTGDYDLGQVPADGHRRNAGIGLSVCDSIVRAHGGALVAENTPEGGALFRFTLMTEDYANEQQV